MKRISIAGACCTTPAAMGFWAAMFGLFYGAGLLLTSIWTSLEHYGDTLILSALAAACLVNFARNRTLHCGLTGPLFVLGALAALLIEAGVWSFDLAALWGAVLVGVALAFLVEWRTVGAHGSSNADS